MFGVEGRDGRSRKVGALEEAHGGTLYSTRSPTCRSETQAKILRVLVDQNFQRVERRDARPCRRAHHLVEFARSAPGSSQKARSGRNCFIVSRSCRSACRRSPNGARTSPNSIEFFMDQVSATSGMPRRKIADDAMAVLQSHDWPGNIRQLRNNVERLMILAPGDPEAEITAEMLPSEIGALVPATPTGRRRRKADGPAPARSREVFEREYLVAQINRFGGNISRTAEFIGMERSALHRKLKSLRID